MTPSTTQCLYCNQDNHSVPLLKINYKDQNFWICAQHLPILIHEPAKLAGMLPGAEDMQPAEHHDDH